MKPHQLQQLPVQYSESGFTIIESLVALVVVAILMAAIAPVLVISTATRVQARRVELATQTAKAFVEGIQTKTISEDKITKTELVASTDTANRKFLSSTADYLLSSVDAPTNKNDLYCFNKNGSITLPANCSSEVQFYIQAFQSVVKTSTNSDEGYRLGIRVYRSDAQFDSLTKTANNNGKGKAQATFSGGLGNLKTPLVEMTTEIVRGKPSYSALCQRLGGC